MPICQHFPVKKALEFYKLHSMYYERSECKARARETLIIMKAAVLVCRDATELCTKMIASLELWPDTLLTARVLDYFKAKDAAAFPRESAPLHTGRVQLVIL